MSQSTNLIRWLLAGICFGIVVMMITFVVVWRQFTANYNVRMNQISTLSSLHALRDAADAFRVEHGRYPTSFIEFCKKYTQNDVVPINDDGVPVDLLNRPLIYIPNAEHPLIISNGEDGKPGGEGFNRDLSSDDERDRLPPFPLSEYLRSRLARPTFDICLRAGGFAALAFLITVRPKEFSSGFKPPWFRMIATTLFTVFAAMFITMVQLLGH